ncbi:DinB family protein [Leadbettera azotonutricia]|uniref:DinB family protein n=1 Tax=Leadbettera azotonutricia (strain ATCC BAA-888 / DSM 13862 / ZAS-9) TaxID=545695 RepID=F5YBG3_LEAAZ|nr:DinB family protein [Leadbettera azotonutricia]AEF82431.1 DinB family protein [Leadbettera azotonutricia ZAS-9]
MQKDTFTLLAKYNKAANKAMDNIIKTLNADEWGKNLGGYFESVRGLCSHLYICDFNWLKRFSKLRSFSALGAPIFSRDPYSFKETLFEDINEYLAKRPELDEKIVAFIDETSETDLSANLKYTDSSGTAYERNFSGLLLHFLNHDTHHRGMISVYLEILGHENDFNGIGQVM